MSKFIGFCKLVYSNSILSSSNIKCVGKFVYMTGLATAPSPPLHIMINNKGILTQKGATIGYNTVLQQVNKRCIQFI